MATYGGGTYGNGTYGGEDAASTVHVPVLLDGGTVLKKKQVPGGIVKENESA